MSRSTVSSAPPGARLKAFSPLVYLALLGCITTAGMECALAQASPWAPGEKSQARLLAAGGLEKGRYLAGVEVKLAPNTLTYWKLPGDAGVPPVFSFDGSVNVKAMQALYPAPRRYAEASGEAFGYRDQVIFPVMVTPVDPAKPVSLALKLDYATCEKICIPAQAMLHLDLAPGARASEQAGLLGDWLARTPRPVGDPAAPRPVLTPAERTNAWHVRFEGTAPADLFAEGPDDWFFDTRRTPDGFDLTLAQKPADAPAGPVELVLTMVSGESAFEARTPLDVGRGKP